MASATRRRTDARCTTRRHNRVRQPLLRLHGQHDDGHRWAPCETHGAHRPLRVAVARKQSASIEGARPPAHTGIASCGHRVCAAFNTTHRGWLEVQLIAGVAVVTRLLVPGVPGESITSVTGFVVGFSPSIESVLPIPEPLPYRMSRPEFERTTGHPPGTPQGAATEPLRLARLSTPEREHCFPSGDGCSLYPKENTMFASIAPRSVARTCVLLGGSGYSRPLTMQSRPVAALLRPLPPSSEAAGSALPSRSERS